MRRSEWFFVLRIQLLQLKAEDFAGVDETPPPSSQKRRWTPVHLTHALQQAEDWVVVSGVQKRRQRSCKFCALLRTGKKKSFTTTYYSERCPIDDAKGWLCNKFRRQYKCVAKICYDVWHDDFNAGQDIPAHAAMEGHLDVVKWLYENTSHGCTTNAMDHAAGNGHVDVVRWLQINRKEGCLRWTMNNAA
ncbi:hypothetical protein P3T76_009762 [Phytophthora citrophthora]|uniref:Uncharacterized protein n=1 Tax=Phytophthora citrophthora TaxID=4793 RepID=A0AAD9LIU2_9STRA|nr:hypothetical protein P3T76_009762 [Phytophthora citrophthora]